MYITCRTPYSLCSTRGSLYYIKGIVKLTDVLTVMSRPPFKEGKMNFNRSCFLGKDNPDYRQAMQTSWQSENLQTSLVEFPVRKSDTAVWNEGLELLGQPKSARITSYSQTHFMDLYYS